MDLSGVTEPLRTLAERVHSEFGEVVNILPLPLLDESGDVGLDFVPLRASGAHIRVVYAVGVFTIFFENITAESHDPPAAEDPAEWAYLQVRSIALNGCFRRVEPWAWGLFSTTKTYVGATPDPTKTSAIVERWSPWVDTSNGAPDS
jgi:hypothetical protein